jgi:hypothetical protein
LNYSLRLGVHTYRPACDHQHPERDVFERLKIDRLEIMSPAQYSHAGKQGNTRMKFLALAMATLVVLPGLAIAHGATTTGDSAAISGVIGQQETRATIELAMGPVSAPHLPGGNGSSGAYSSQSAPPPYDPPPRHHKKPKHPGKHSHHQ